ncbi:MAG: tripartite tricarboxylate transporter substrate binding protein [Xanthobacteraceae bacterium]|jgi:tripartite-type tricarboxylate transporter receptor subunit TctC
MRRWNLIFLLIIGIVGSDAGPALAQRYPNKPIRIIVPFAAGGSVDALARVIGQQLSETFSQPIVVENRPGAGGNIGSDVVAKAAPDGYTILQNTVGLAIAPAIFRTLPFDTLSDFTPVTQLVATTLILVASPQLTAKSLPELIALAKAKSRDLNYGMSGVGNPLHLTMEMLKVATGIDIQAVPYRGDAPIMTALVAGEVQVAIVPLAIARPLIESGQIRALAVTRAQRSPVLPDVPTIGETVPGFESTSWQGWFAPAKTPREIVELVQGGVAKALQVSDVLERLRTWTNEPVGSRPQEFDAYFKAEVAKFKKVVKEANIPLQE